MDDAPRTRRTPADIVGAGDSEDDWRIDPSRHAEMFEAEGPALAALLRRDRVQTLARHYEERNAEAVEAHNDFKARAGKANTAIFLTVAGGALMLISSGLQDDLGANGPWFVRGFGLLGAGSSWAAAMWLGQVRAGKLAEKWTMARAKAEAKRLAYFKQVISAASDTTEHRFALEYVRRFLLDNQIDYFRERGRKHEDTSGSNLIKSTRAAVIASILTAVAVIFPHLAPIAGLGVVASAYATLVASRSVVDADSTNAERYRSARDRLEDRRLELETFRTRTEGGDAGAVTEFFVPVFTLLEADHKAFLEDSELREAAIGQMKGRLDAASERLRS